MSSSPEERSVLLAASYPPRGYKSKADSHEIAAAVKALAGAIFQRGWTLVFGGHPKISPLVLMIAREYAHRNQVIIYQSAYFENHIGPETLALAEEHWGHIELVPNDPNEPAPQASDPLDPTECPNSLTLMRERMMSHPGIAALVLVGGDTGLRQELDLFKLRHRNLPVIPIGRPGGIAFELTGERHVPGMPPALADELVSSRSYMTLCSELVRYLAPR